jgi:hypothetical protein
MAEAVKLLEAERKKNLPSPELANVIGCLNAAIFLLNKFRKKA